MMGPLTTWAEVSALLERGLRALGPVELDGPAAPRDVLTGGALERENWHREWLRENDTRIARALASWCSRERWPSRSTEIAGALREMLSVAIGTSRALGRSQTNPPAQEGESAPPSTSEEMARWLESIAWDEGSIARWAARTEAVE